MLGPKGFRPVPSDARSMGASFVRPLKLPFLSIASRSPDLNRLTNRPPDGRTTTSRRSTSSFTRRTASPPAAGSETSSPPAQATCSRSVEASHATPRGAPHTSRRDVMVLLARSIVTRAPPRRSATWTRWLPSSATRPGSSPIVRGIVATTEAVSSRTMETRSRSGSAAIAVRPSRVISNVPPVIGGGVRSAVSTGLSSGTPAGASVGPVPPKTVPDGCPEPGLPNSSLMLPHAIKPIANKGNPLRMVIVGTPPEPSRTRTTDYTRIALRARRGIGAAPRRGIVVAYSTISSSFRTRHTRRRSAAAPSSTQSTSRKARCPSGCTLQPEDPATGGDGCVHTPSSLEQT